MIETPEIQKKTKANMEVDSHAEENQAPNLKSQLPKAAEDVKRGTEQGGTHKVQSQTNREQLLRERKIRSKVTNYHKKHAGKLVNSKLYSKC